MKTVEGQIRPELHRSRPMTIDDAMDEVYGWLLTDDAGNPCLERIGQAEAAKRLGISRQRLSQLSDCYPPRSARGKGRDSGYHWPALAFWWIELQVARRYEKSDPWAWELWRASRLETAGRED